MQELIEQLTAKAGISAEQATKSIDVIKGFVKNKFPMLAGAVDQMLGADKAEATAATSNVAASAVTEIPAAANPSEKKEDSSMLDKISDVIPGQVGEKIEDFAKGIGDKLGGLFGK